MTRVVDDPYDESDDGGLLGGEGPIPKLVVVGIVWAGFGVVALIAALLLRSAGVAVFGVLCVLAGGGLYLGHVARRQLADEERLLRVDPSDPGGPDDPDGPEGADDEGSDAGDDHATRVMSTSGHDRGEDDIIDAEYTEYYDYEQAPADQDDGTGYDEEELAHQRWQEDRRAREAAEDRDDEDAEVIEADDPEAPDDGATRDGHGARDPEGSGSSEGSGGSASGTGRASGTDGTHHDGGRG